MMENGRVAGTIGARFVLVFAIGGTPPVAGCIETPRLRKSEQRSHRFDPFFFFLSLSRRTGLASARSIRWRDTAVDPFFFPCPSWFFFF